MPFQYSCFVSYRHIEGELSERFIKELSEALVSYVSPHCDLGIYVDSERLQGGDYFNATLERAICESVCMILVYTPNYFDEKHSYCAREYQSMKELEKERIKNRQYSLIIPIIYRGKIDSLPEEIKHNLQLYDFSKFTLCPGDVNIQSNPNYVEKLDKIGIRVRELYELMAMESDPCEDCNEFRLSTDADVQDLIEESRYVSCFPGRMP